MKIDRLIVRETSPQYKIIRDIKFNTKGLNLILDETNNVKQNTGNSVGKTTVIKIIDLCLGANSVSILYKDKDTKAENNAIKNYLSKYCVEAELLLSNESDHYNIVRALYNKGKRYIDEIEYKESEFNSKLKELLFNSTDKFPTLRQLIPRFIRIENQQLENMIKFIPMASNDDIEMIHLFLLNIDAKKILNDKNLASRELKSAQKEYEILLKAENSPNLSFLEEKIKLIDDQIKQLTEQRKKIDYIQSYKEELENRDSILSKIDQNNISISSIDFDVELNKKSLSDLEQEVTSIDVMQIKELYNEVKAFIPNLHKTYEDVLSFHVSMIRNKIDFVKNNITELEKQRSSLEEQRDSLIKQKQNISIELIDSGLLNDLNSLNTQIDELNFEKGIAFNTIDKLKIAEKSISDWLSKYNSAEEDLKKMDSNISDTISLFNKFFSLYSEKLYNEKYLFTYNSKWKSMKESPFNVNTIEGNPGTGKKHAQIVAFDLAYLKLLENMNTNFPQFIIHDKLENTHINQLTTIFELCSDINGQFIVPILKERIEKIDNKLLEKATIITLSQESKFFKI
jgi:uncharacterized protein YydD (DUF2326 family)